MIEVFGAVLLVIGIVVDNLRGGETMGRFTLSAFRYHADTGRPVSIGVHKQENHLTDAWKTAKDMLLLNDLAVYVEIYRGSEKVDTVTRKEL